MHELAGSENETIVLERFFTLNLDLLCIADVKGNFIKVNPAWESILGYSVEELEKRSFLDFVHPEDLESTLMVMAELGEQKQVLNFTNRYRSNDGSYRYIEWRSHPYGDYIYAAARDITERVRLEAELEGQKRFLKAVLDAIPDVIYFKDKDSRYLGCNKAFAEKIAKSDEKDVVGKTAYDFYSDLQQVAQYRKQDEEIMNWQKSQINNTRIRTSDGIIDQETIKTPFYDENGDVVGTIGIGRDVTDRKKMINIIEAQTNFLKQMLNAIPDLIFYKDIEGNYLGCNKAFAEQFIGLKEEEIVGKTDLDLVKDEALARFFRQKDKEVLDAGEARSNEETIEMSDNRIINVEVMKTPFFDETGKITGLIGVSRDISLRKSVEEKLRTSEEKFRQLFDNMTNGFSLHEVITDESGEPIDFKFLLVNRAYEESMNQTSEQIVGKTIKEINPAADELMIKNYCKVGLTGEPFHLEYLSKSFNKYFNVYTFSPKKGQFASIFEDVSERKKVQLDLVKAKEAAEASNIAKSQFLANMSHEIRTPMNGIFGFLELLNHSQLSQEQRDYIREAKSASEVLLHLINDILDLSKIEAGKLIMEKINFKLRTAVEDAMSLFVPKAYEKHLELHTLIKANVPEEVRGDPSRLRQVLNNLTSNALKFTKNGEITIVVETIEEVNGFATLKFEVKDTGIGINEEDVKNIFKPFSQADASTTRKFGGTGLGLAITRELVTMMEGDVGIKSVPGKGSTFYFTARFEIIKKGTTACCDYASLENIKVLIVDDNDNNRKIMRSYLEDAGCIVMEAQAGGKAIAAILDNTYTENKIQMVLVDYQMPGMNGYELATMLNMMPSTKDLKLILVTSVAQKGDATNAREQGFSGYLSKPVRRDELLNCMAIVLGLKQDTGESQQIVTKYAHHENQSALKPKLLLVEDNEMNCKVIITMLKSHNMTCDVAMNGKEAYQAVLKKDYDLVFMDCQMPVMDGYEATKKIRKAETDGKYTRIIAMTANAMEGDREKCLKVGMDDYISKPINFEIMFKMIEESTVHKGKRKVHFDFIDKNMEVFAAESGLAMDGTKELFEYYVNSLPEIMKNIEEALVHSDFKELSRFSHQLKGSSGTLRIKEIYELARKLETSALEKDKSTCEITFLEIKKLFK